MILVEKSLMEKFNEILKKHGNEVWAREELEYLVYDAHKGQYESLSVEDKNCVDHFMDVLKKLYN